MKYVVVIRLKTLQWYILEIGKLHVGTSTYNLQVAKAIRI